MTAKIVVVSKGTEIQLVDSATTRNACGLLQNGDIGFLVFVDEILEVGGKALVDLWGLVWCGVVIRHAENLTLKRFSKVAYGELENSFVGLGVA